MYGVTIRTFCTSARLWCTLPIISICLALTRPISTAAQPPMVIRLVGFDLHEFDSAEDCPEVYKRVHLINDTSSSRSSPAANVDAAVWHLPTWYHRKLVQTRPANQRWVLVSQESPINIISGNAFYSSPMVHQFTSTATYQLASDVRWVYGNCSRTSLTPPRGQDVNYAAGKRHLVSWAVSNCASFSRRDNLARRLHAVLGDEHMHVYGGCSWPGLRVLSCPRGNVCERDMSERYKFTLAFENSLCTDYLTEKTFTSLLLQTPQVPVVLSRTKLVDRLPPGSYVDVRDFASPEHLAKHLLYLNSNDTAYNEYFAWRRRGWRCHGMSGRCAVLRHLLHDRNTNAAITPLDLNTTFSPQSSCVDHSQYIRESRPRTSKEGGATVGGAKVGGARDVGTKEAGVKTSQHYPLAAGRQSVDKSRDQWAGVPVDNGMQVVFTSQSGVYNTGTYLFVFASGLAFAAYVANKMHMFKRNNRSRLITSSTERMF